MKTYFIKEAVNKKYNLIPHIKGKLMAKTAV
jgi:hypothetical protein